MDVDATIERMGGSFEIFAQVAQSFIVTAPAMLAAVETAVAGKNHDARRRSAHSLKGAIANFGVGIATECARALEGLDDSPEDWRQAEELLVQMRAQVAAVTLALGEATKRQSSS